MDKVEGTALIIVLLAVVGATASIYYYESVYRPSHSSNILVSGKMFENGGWEPAEIRVKKGETVRLRIMSNDVTHGLLIPELDINTGPIAVGKSKTIEFVADETGEFAFYCTVLCGSKHHLMRGVLIVEEGK